MAQLARCPACYSEIELPAEMGSDDAWAECPACDESFALSDAKPRHVKQAKLVSPPREAIATPEPPADTPEIVTTTDETLRPMESGGIDLDIPTLESFLGGAAEAESTADTVSKSKSPTISNFDTLDDLMKVSLSEAKASAAEGDGSGMNDSTASEPAEANPQADRFHPTLSEMFGHSAFDNKPAVAATPASDVESAPAAGESINTHSIENDNIEETDNPQKSLNENESADEARLDPANFESLAPATSTATPSFDFSVGGDDDPKSLRAAMGFTEDDPLEVVEEQPEFSGLAETTDSVASPELEVAGSRLPRGIAPAKRRSPLWTAVRVLLGVTTSGVIGLGVGYLAILWIFHFTGRTEEPFALAQYYPDAVKPATFRNGETPNAPQSPSAGPDALDGANDNSALVTNEHQELLAPLGIDSDPGVEPANFESDLSTDAGTADAPEPWESEALPAIPVVVTGAPNYTAAELQQFTTDAAEQSATLLADGPVDRSKGGSYATIAKLADALTFGEGVQDASWKSNARQVFPKLFADNRSRMQIAQIARFWLTSDKRGHGGIFFSGSPDAGRQQGSIAEYVFTLPTGQQLTVLTPQALPGRIANAPSVAVVGSVIDEPASQIEGYAGSAQQAIWSQDLMPISE